MNIKRAVEMIKQLFCEFVISGLAADDRQINEIIKSPGNEFRVVIRDGITGVRHGQIEITLKIFRLIKFDREHRA